ncbi:ATP-binding cassette domain-containing protein [Heliobacterium undosum]|uniref:ATP-binding cassette domain-containing protein n=1 Tax=Heliomicrobium undosum TaxID=121734 RepID=A0A845LAJ0_9FIRM|nr:ABC transporter ATP-binding protein [Heliomicrobium undosum]MZP30708.1 ATP-binding cassette domain-containing protein [Heliomicrobium undosum]
MQKPIAQIRRIKKKISDRTIIDDFSLDIYPGQVLGLLGPNGAGKTTLIKMILGLMAPTQGEIRIGGSCIQRNFTAAITNVGAIVETPALYGYLSGYQNLLHYARMAGGIGHERIRTVTAQVGLEGRIHDKVGTYSLGMRQRLGLAQALLHNPALLILDEPTNGLDPAGIRDLRNHLRQLAHEEGVAVMVSSHLLSEMELICDRVAIIQQGKLIQALNVDATAKGALEAAFLAMTEGDGTCN